MNAEGKAVLCWLVSYAPPLSHSSGNSSHLAKQIRTTVLSSPISKLATYYGLLNVSLLFRTELVIIVPHDIVVESLYLQIRVLLEWAGSVRGLASMTYSGEFVENTIHRIVGVRI